MTSPSRSSITCSFFFLERNNDLYKRQRPYAFKFRPKNGCPMTNAVYHRVEGIRVEDIRGHESDFEIEKNGFTVLTIEEQLEYADYFDEAKAQKYFSQMEDVLKTHLGARRVDVFRHGIRKRHHSYPVSDGEAFEFDQPSTVVHIDTTREGTENEIRLKYGEEAESLLKGRFQWIKYEANHRPSIGLNI